MADKNKNTIIDKITDNPGKATAAGALVGAAFVAAAVLAMKNDKTREKAEEMLDKVGEKAVEFMDDMKENAKTQLEEKTQETVADVKKAVEK